MLYEMAGGPIDRWLTEVILADLYISSDGGSDVYNIRSIRSLLPLAMTLISPLSLHDKLLLRMPQTTMYVYHNSPPS